MVTLVGRSLSAGLRVLELTGVTPNGELYRARYPSGREVAVLLLPPEASNSEPFIALRQRLRDAIRIQHPNVAAIYEVADTDDQLVYVVVESLTGELLADTLARRGALPVSEALDLCRQAADGLQAAHEAGWVHGRLSPESILLSRATGDGSLVKLIGFTPEFLLRTGEAEHPTIMRVSRDRDGRSFSARRVEALQRGKAIFTMAASFHVDETSGDWSGVAMRSDVPSPEELDAMVPEVRHLGHLRR